MTRALRVLVVGPRHGSAHSRGGMASVMTIMREHADERTVVRTVATYVDDPRWLRLGVGVTGVLRAILLLLTRRTDVLHVHLAHGGSVVRKGAVLRAARVAGVPAIVHAHSFDFAGWFDRLGPLGQRAVRWALPADRWLVLGDALAESYSVRLRIGRDRVHVLANPAASAATPRHDTAGPVEVLFLGRHGRRKGSFDLVSALALLRAEPGPGLHVVAAGDGAVDEVRAAAAAAGLDDVLEVRGWVDTSERDGLLAAAEVFVLPSHDEGLPMALLEAMAAGLAVITTPVGAIGDTVTDGVDALLVAPGEVEQLAGALRAVAGDAELRSRLGAAAAQRAAGLAVEPWWDALVMHWRAIASS